MNSLQHKIINKDSNSSIQVQKLQIMCKTTQ